MTASANNREDIAKKRVTILGSTGSVGTQALEVAKSLGFSITALAAHSDVKAMEGQIRRFKPEIAVLFDKDAADDLRLRVRDLQVSVASGMDGLCEAAAADTDIVLNSVVGMVGLKPTIAAMEAGHDIALANKETLVAGGALVMETARRRGIRILPVDSEHSAVFQCLQGSPPNKAVKRLILTASGGPFFGKTISELESVTPSDALKHPNWSMGSKITIDSATMMNKGLELIEARWLFDVAPVNIDIVIHRESVVHSLIEYDDRSVIAQLGVPDMKIPIQYALTWPYRFECGVKRLDLTEWGKLSFYPPDFKTFVCMDACRRAIEEGGLRPAAVNAANEIAVALFLNGEIGFLDIGRLVSQALDYPLPQPDGRLDRILETDAYIREKTTAAAQKSKR
ncbi:MAG: 1-deoxy-D-xylulose-5-phosphate reductoisomerase [Clostridiales bacterium]|nr:1-deoxy-D-xylulose-5-phosphate reductoisomerase [Clostridiales bacterium]